MDHSLPPENGSNSYDTVPIKKPLTTGEERFFLSFYTEHSWSLPFAISENLKDKAWSPLNSVNFCNVNQFVQKQVYTKNIFFESPTCCFKPFCKWEKWELFSEASSAGLCIGLNALSRVSKRNFLQTSFTGLCLGENES